MSRGLSLSDMMRIKVMQEELGMSRAKFAMLQEDRVHQAKMQNFQLAEAQAQSRAATIRTFLADQAAVKSQQELVGGTTDEGKVLEEPDVLEQFYEMTGVEKSERDKRRPFDIAGIRVGIEQATQEKQQLDRMNAAALALRERQAEEAALSNAITLAKGGQALIDAYGGDDNIRQTAQALLDSGVFSKSDVFEEAAQRAEGTEYGKARGLQRAVIESQAAKVRAGTATKKEQREYNEAATLLQGVLDGGSVQGNSGAPGVVRPTAPTRVLDSYEFTRLADEAVKNRPAGASPAQVLKRLTDQLVQQGMMMSKKQQESLEKRLKGISMRESARNPGASRLYDMTTQPR